MSLVLVVDLDGSDEPRAVRTLVKVVDNQGWVPLGQKVTTDGNRNGSWYRRKQMHLPNTIVLRKQGLHRSHELVAELVKGRLHFKEPHAGLRPIKGGLVNGEAAVDFVREVRGWNLAAQ